MKILPLVTFVFFVLGTLAHDQGAGSMPLRLTLQAQVDSVCRGEKLTLTLTLANTGEGPIVIDARGIGYRMSYFWTLRQRSGRSGAGARITVGHDGTGTEPYFRVLQPGESFTKTTSFSENSRPGRYRLRTAYGQFMKETFRNADVWRGVVDSDEIEINVRKCGTR